MSHVLSGNDGHPKRRKGGQVGRGKMDWGGGIE